MDLRGQSQEQTQPNKKESKTHQAKSAQRCLAPAKPHSFSSSIIKESKAATEFSFLWKVWSFLSF